MTLFIPLSGTKHKDKVLDLSEFMTTREAAKKLGFNVRSIPYMIKSKTLKGTRIGRVWLVTRKSVQHYIKKTEGMSKNDPRRK